MEQLRKMCFELTNMASYATSLVTLYSQSAYKRTIEATTAMPATINTPVSAPEVGVSIEPVYLIFYLQRLLRCMLSLCIARIGIIRMIISVNMLMAAVEKYITGKLLQPSGNVGDHACEGRPLHSKAWCGQFCTYGDQRSWENLRS